MKMVTETLSMVNQWNQQQRESHVIFSPLSLFFMSRTQPDVVFGLRCVQSLLVHPSALQSTSMSPKRGMTLRTDIEMAIDCRLDIDTHWKHVSFHFPMCAQIVRYMYSPPTLTSIHERQRIYLPPDFIVRVNLELASFSFSRQHRQGAQGMVNKFALNALHANVVRNSVYTFGTHM